MGLILTQTELLTLINTSGMRLLNIVNDLLDAAKISNSASKLIVKQQPVSLFPLEALKHLHFETCPQIQLASAQGSLRAVRFG